MAEKLEIVVAAKDQASAVLQGVAGKLKGEIKAIEGASRGLATTSSRMAGTTVAGFGQMQGSAKGLTGQINIARVAFAGMAVGAAGAMVGLISKAAEAEAAATKLRVAIAATGQGVEQSKLEDLAKQLQKVTVYDDEAIMGMMSFLAAAKLNQVQIEKLTPALLDMASFLGIDLAAAGKAAGLAIEKGSTAPLRRLKLVVDEAKFALDPIGAILDAVGGKAKGMAEAAGKDAAGQLQIFKHAVDELEESLGTILLPTLKMVTPLMVKLADAATALSKVPGLSQAVSGTVMAIGAIGMLGMVGPPLGKGFGMLRKVPGIGKAIGGIASRFGGAAAGTIAGGAVMGAAAVAAPAAIAAAPAATGIGTIITETAIASAAATTAANVGTRIGVATGLRAVAGVIAGVAGPAGLAAVGALAARGGIADTQFIADETEKALATSGALVTPGGQIDPSKVDPRYKAFMSKWRIGRVGAGKLDVSALTPEEYAQARLDPAANIRLGEAEAKAFQPMAFPETEDQRKRREAAFPQPYTGQDILAAAGMESLGKGAYRITPRVPLSARGGAGASPIVSNTAPNVDVSGKGNEILIRVQMPEQFSGHPDDATTAYLEDLNYEGDDF